jgi:hypothetical protein
MQKCLITALLDAVRDDRGESSGKTKAPKVRMRAYAADFGEARETHTLPSHCRQLTIDADPDKSPHGMRALQEGPRLGYACQRQHFRCVRIAKFHDGFFAWLRLYRLDCHELNSLGLAYRRKTLGYAYCRDLQKKDGLVIADEFVKCRKTRGAIVVRRGENVNVTSETLGEFTALGQVWCMRK